MWEAAGGMNGTAWASESHRGRIGAPPSATGSGRGASPVTCAFSSVRSGRARLRPGSGRIASDTAGSSAGQTLGKRQVLLDLRPHGERAKIRTLSSGPHPSPVLLPR